MVKHNIVQSTHNNTNPPHAHQTNQQYAIDVVKEVTGQSIVQVKTQ